MKKIRDIPNACEKIRDASQFISTEFGKEFDDADNIEFSINHVRYQQHLKNSSKFRRDMEKYETIAKKQSARRDLKNIKKPVEYSICTFDTDIHHDTCGDGDFSDSDSEFYEF